jgi:cytochrome c553
MKTFFVIASLIAFTVVCASFADDPKYKNLKVLSKKTTHEEMDSIMKHFSLSLGVKCGFCHVKNGDKWDFASDENKHKDVSRSMMRMTNRINKKFFRDASTPVITCYSCHNGKEEPGVNPPMPKDD